MRPSSPAVHSEPVVKRPADASPKPRYVIITPVRDEASYIGETAASVAGQNVLPVEWVIVDDGSTDGTGAIVDSLSRQWPWIRVLHRENRGRRDADVGAIGAFLDGYRSLRHLDWDFLANLDADLTLEPDYFEKCFQVFAAQTNLGIGGGSLYHLDAFGGTRAERGPENHVRGATKIYRRDCWEVIGGLAEVPGWDTLDEVKAQMAGWRVRSFEHIRALHRRPTGHAGGQWRDSVKNGHSDYFLGYHPLYMFVKCARRAFTRPFLASGLGHAWGYLSCYFQSYPQVGDRELVHYVRRQQLRRLVFMDTTWK